MSKKSGNSKKISQIEASDILEAILSVRNLLILQMYNSEIPVLDIARAAGMSPNNLYNIIPKKSKKKDSKKEENSMS